MAKNILAKEIAFTAFLPFSSLFWTIKENRSNVYPLVFGLFFFFIGTQIIATDSNDIGRYMLAFSFIANSPNTTFLAYFYSLAEDNQIDFYLPFMTWLISKVTTSTQLYAGILAMMTGLCFGLNFAYISRHLKNNCLSITLLLFTLLFVPNPSFYTHRWWMAMQVFLLGALPYILEGKYKYLLFSIASIFVHFSLLYPLVLLLVYKFIPKKSLLPFVGLFIVANLIEELEISAIANAFKNYLPEAFNSRNEAYINAEELDHNWFSQSGRFVWKLINLIMTLYIYVRLRSRLDSRKYLKSMFAITLLIGTFAAVANMTEWGWRFLDLTNFLFCSLYILILADEETFGLNFTRTIRICSPFFLYVILFQIRSLCAIIGLKALLFGNIFTTWFIEDTVSILSYVK